MRTPVAGPGGWAPGAPKACSAQPLEIGPGAASLVIGIGNPLRGDDGIGWRLAARLPAQPGLAVRCRQQLTPELAADLAAVQRVLFLDAWLEPWPEDQAAKALRCLGSAQSPISVQRPLRLEEIGAPDALGRSTQAWAGAAPWSGASHGLSPQDLLVLGRSLYGHAPRAHQLLLPAHRFDHGEGISPALAPRLGEARGLIAGWIAAAWALPDAGHA